MNPPSPNKGRRVGSVAACGCQHVSACLASGAYKLPRRLASCLATGDAGEMVRIVILPGTFLPKAGHGDVAFVLAANGPPELSTNGRLGPCDSDDRTRKCGRDPNPKARGRRWRVNPAFGVACRRYASFSHRGI